MSQYLWITHAYKRNDLHEQVTMPATAQSRSDLRVDLCDFGSGIVRQISPRTGNIRRTLQLA